jgi:Ca-activated chloride channel homolog
MSKHKLYVMLGLLAIVIAFTVTPPPIAQTQSACSPDQRKEFVLTAVDKEDNVVDKLQAGHLSLKVGGAPATISDVVFQTKPPLDLAVLIDASVSQEGVLSITKAAAQAFVASVPIGGQDRVAVVSFSDKPNYVQPLTSDFSGIAAAINDINLDVPPGYVGGGVVMSSGPPPGPGPMAGSTSLWDTITTATATVFGDKSEKRRRAVLLFTDGVDTSSSGKFNAISEEAIGRNVTVFSLGLADEKTFQRVDEQALKKLSEQTGGIAQFPGKKKEKLEAALTQIARHLRGNYVVGYCGGAAKDRAKLQLEVVDAEMRTAKPVLAYRRY